MLIIKGERLKADSKVHEHIKISSEALAQLYTDYMKRMIVRILKIF